MFFLADSVSTKAEEKRTEVRVTPDSSSALSNPNSVPGWILDKIRAKGRKLESSYGAMVAVKDGGTTIIAIKKENDAKFRSVYEKLIKDSYEADGMEYLVLGAKP